MLQPIFRDHTEESLHWVDFLNQNNLVVMVSQTVTFRLVSLESQTIWIQQQHVYIILMPTTEIYYNCKDAAKWFECCDNLTTLLSQRQKYNTIVEVWSYLQWFSRFSWVKSSHSNRIQQDQDFCLKAKDFPTQISQQFAVMTNRKSPVCFESDFCVSCASASLHYVMDLLRC